LAGILLFCFLQILDYSLIHQTNITDAPHIDNLSWNILDIIIDSNYISISGWVQKPGNELDNFNIVVVLENSLTKEAVALPTVLLGTEVMDTASPTDIVYSKTIFLSKVNTWLIDFDRNNYDIYINFQTKQDSFFIKTNQSLKNSEGN
jgi:hypothetical protein